MNYKAGDIIGIKCRFGDHEVVASRDSDLAEQYNSVFFGNPKGMLLISPWWRFWRRRYLPDYQCSHDNKEWERVLFKAKM